MEDKLPQRLEIAYDLERLSEGDTVEAILNGMPSRLVFRRKDATFRTYPDFQFIGRDSRKDSGKESIIEYYLFIPEITIIDGKIKPFHLYNRCSVNEIGTQGYNFFNEFLKRFGE